MPRPAIVGGAAALAALLIAAFFFSVRGGQVPLFAVPLHAEQLDEVEQRLAEWSVPFAPVTDNILVDAKQRSTLLLRLSMAGVPHSHIESSSEMLAKVGTLTPQTILDEQKRTGLADDLELALRGIEGIDDASIIIAPAKPAIYADESARVASASVRLHLHPGARLPPNAISGIRSFIAAGVPDLAAKNVTIVDDRGIALRDQPVDVDADPQVLQAAVQSALDQSFGLGTAVAHLATSVDTATLQSRRSMVILVDQRRAPPLDEVSAIASVAGGFDIRRGDRLDVRTVQFQTGAPRRKAVWFALLGSALNIAPTAIVCIAVLFGLRIGLRPALSVAKTIIRSSAVTRGQRRLDGFAPTQVRGALRGEPPHTAAAIISALPAATAAAVLDLYPPDERKAIIRRMSRAHSPLIPDVESFISHA
ncbi:MAG: hypothetical protein JO233_07365 [Candidatus Eremiobacteraeota bacterium]|nr:hypothetical protein [Candidatus Eremiobacteraeota bacterium]